MKIDFFCLKKGQGLSVRAAPPHPRIYIEYPTPGSLVLDKDYQHAR